MKQFSFQTNVITALLTVFIFHLGFSQDLELSIQTDRPGAKIQPTMWGIFFEDINFAADGGVYAELVKNRSFEFLHPMTGWKEHQYDRFAFESNAGKTLVINRGEQYSNPRFARVSVFREKGYGLSNEGFRGMGIRKDNNYRFSVHAAQLDGSQTLRIELVAQDGNVIGSASVTPSGKEWKQYETTIRATETDAKATMNIWFDGKGVLDIDMVSLFPEDTWRGRKNGLRKDLVNLLYELKPGFLRFPGGCIVEGRDLSQRYQWKKTVGNIEDREMIINRWNTEFSHRVTPDYFQTFGLGFYEYFLLAEDLGAEPLPILSCGIACQFNTAEVVPMDELGPYIQDALDLIEFANGDTSTKWGALRAAMGHPEPFNMKFIGIGNEQWGTEYIERYKEFAKAIKAKHPDMILVSGAGPFPAGELFEHATKALRELNAELVDEHYYNNPEWFLANATRYDSYDRNGPKIFAGEYAAQSVATTSPDNKNNWRCALSEAAFMTGLERNADIVHLASYAPLFAHAEGWQWTPDLIWFDNLSSYATPNYYVQQLFSLHKGTNVLPVSANREKVTGQNGFYASAVWDEKAKEVILKIVNINKEERRAVLRLDGKRKLKQEAKTITLSSDNGDAVNSLTNPDTIFPQNGKATVKGKKVTVTLKANSLTVIRIPVS